MAHELTRTTMNCVTLIALVTAPLAAAERPDLPTVDGPEATGLVAKLSGRLVYPQPVGGIVSTVLPSLEPKVVRPPGKHPAIHELSGPDRGGRLAVVEQIKNEVVLRIVLEDGSDGGEVLRRPYGGSETRAIGRPALAADGSRVAFVSDTKSVQMRVDPGIVFNEGLLEVWDTKTRQKSGVEAQALDRGLAWFPDGKTLVYSSLLRPDGLPKGWLEAQSAHGAKVGLMPLADGRTPVVHRLDLAGGRSAPLCLGRRSVMSQDGKSMLVQSIGFDWMLYSMESGGLREAKLPGLYDVDRVGVYQGGPVALLPGELVIYWGLPTTGAVQGITTNNSPLVGPKKMPTLKVARLGTREFQTILPSMDQRRCVQFGPGKVSD